MKRIYGIIILFLSWYVLSHFVGTHILPYPHVVIETFIKNYRKELNVHVIASLKRIMIGLMIAVVLGVHIGILMGLSKISQYLLSPFIESIYPIPKVALLPLFILFFGIEDLTKILLIIIIVIFPIIINTRNAISLIPQEYFYVARTMGLHSLHIYRDIIIPAILPSLLTSVRIGIGTSIAVLFLSETIATSYGLGYYIHLFLAINTLKMYTAIFALGLIGTLLFYLVDVLEKRFCRWL